MANLTQLAWDKQSAEATFGALSACLALETGPAVERALTEALTRDDLDQEDRDELTSALTLVRKLLPARAAIHTATDALATEHARLGAPTEGTRFLLPGESPQVVRAVTAVDALWVSHRATTGGGEDFMSLERWLQVATVITGGDVPTAGDVTTT